MAKAVTLDQIKGEVQYQRVDVDVKVMEIGDITVLDDGRRVQNVVVADATGTAELALWQDFIGKLIVDKSYKLKSVMVKCFGTTYSLFTPKEDCDISEIENIKDVVPLQKSIKRTREITNARVIAVSEFASNFLCISCNKGCIKPIKENQLYGRCSQCPTTLLLSSCKVQIYALLTLYSSKTVCC